jgi:N-acetylglucosaminyldiphosphoundecaprenol N-acetyl-beta-D-mannosaminyltransferase
MPKVLDIPLYEFSIPEATNEVMIDIFRGNAKSAKLISATGAHGIITAQEDPEFKKILTEFHYNLPDGMPGVWVGRLKGARKMSRCYGPDFFRSVMRATADKPVKHFFCGGKEGVAEELKTVCNKKFNNNSIAGTYSPPFREMTDMEMRKLGRQIDVSGANIVWIGLSTPKQEKFAYRLKDFTKANYIITVGAAFDFHTAKVKQAPLWMQDAGLEWLYRLLTEPKRLYKRYFKIVPLFIFYNLREATSTLFRKA